MNIIDDILEDKRNEEQKEKKKGQSSIHEGPRYSSLTRLLISKYKSVLDYLEKR